MGRRNTNDNITSSTCANITVSWQQSMRRLTVMQSNNGNTPLECFLSAATHDLFNTLAIELTSSIRNTRICLSALFQPTIEVRCNNETVVNTLLEMLSRALSNSNVKPAQYDAVAYKKLKAFAQEEKMQLKTILAQSDTKTWKLAYKIQNGAITHNDDMPQRKYGMCA